MNILPVPYRSQLGPNSDEHRNDCGPASVLMVLLAYGLAKDKSVDKIFNEIYYSGDVPVHVWQLQNYLSGFGVKNDWKGDLHAVDLFSSLMAGFPVITLIHYSPLVTSGFTQYKNFLGAHFVVVVGIDIKTVCIHDPYTFDSVCGSTKEIPIPIFEQAWSQGHLDNNPDNGAIVMTIPIQDLSVPSVPPFGFKYALNVNGINVRSGPGSNNVLVRTIWRAQTPFVFIIQVSGEWGKLFDDTGWVFMAYLNDVL